MATIIRDTTTYEQLMAEERRCFFVVLVAMYELKYDEKKIIEWCCRDWNWRKYFSKHP